jgi:hypothetical protein
MSDPKNQNDDKSLHGLSVGLGIAGTIAATVIVSAYAASDGFSYLSPNTVPTVTSEDTAAAASGPPLPTETKQELQLVQDKMQDQVKPADEITIEQQEVQQPSEAVEIQESVDINKVDYVPVEEERSDEPSNPAKEEEVHDPAPPVNNDENELTPLLPTLPSLDDKEDENNGEHILDDHHKKGGAKEDKGKKHSDDSISSIVFKGDRHKKDD